MKALLPVPAAARALLRKLGAPADTARLCFDVAFHAPKQGRFQPPPYRVFVDTARRPWLTVQHYNDEPHAVTPRAIRVPTEMTRFTVRVKAGPKAAISAWAAALLGR
ncbi:MAG: hypothetical protein ACOZQL_00850 [Myxococcota bacterium]